MIYCLLRSAPRDGEAYSELSREWRILCKHFTVVCVCAFSSTLVYVQCSGLLETELL